MSHHLTHLGDVVILDPRDSAAQFAYTRTEVALRSGWLSAFISAVSIAALAAFFRKSALLPIFSAVIVLASPMSWAYSHLLLILFLPALPGLRNGRFGWLFVIAIGAATQAQINYNLHLLPIPIKTGMIIGTLAMLITALAFAVSPVSHQLRSDQSAQ